jgi:hypothetical protein
MRYIARFIACLLAMAVGMSAILFFVAAFDYKWLIPLCIFDIIGFIYLLDNTENIADNLIKFIDKMRKDSRHE